MLSRIPFAAAAAALAATLALGGCSTNTAGVVTHTPALQTVGGRNTARSAVQSTLLIAETTNGIALPGGPTPAGVLRRFAALVNGRRTAGAPSAAQARRASATGTSTGACNNGVKQSQTTDSSGTQTTITDYYYDAACATLEAEVQIAVQPASSNETNGTGTITVYSQAGAVRVVQKLTLTVDSTAATSTKPASENFTLNDSASATAGGTATASVGATCVGEPGSAALSCTVAHTGNSSGTLFGEALSTTATAGASGASNTATTSIAFFASPTLGIAETGVTWGITGGTAYNSGTAKFTYTSSGLTGSGTLTMTDSLYTYAETATLSATGITISLVENPNEVVTTTTNIATATTDQTGTGTVSYADGTSDPIAGGLVGF